MSERLKGCLEILFFVVCILLMGMFYIQGIENGSEEKSIEIGFGADMNVLNQYKKYEIDKTEYPFRYLYVSPDNKEFILVDEEQKRCIQGAMIEEKAESIKQIYTNHELNYLICATDKGNLVIQLDFILKGEEFPEKEAIKIGKIKSEELLELKLVS